MELSWRVPRAPKGPHESGTSRLAGVPGAMLKACLLGAWCSGVQEAPPQMQRRKPKRCSPGRPVKTPKDAPAGGPPPGEGLEVLRLLPWRVLTPAHSPLPSGLVHQGSHLAGQLGAPTCRERAACGEPSECGTPASGWVACGTPACWGSTLSAFVITAV